MLPVLLIEDDKDLGRILCEQLAECGYEATWCESIAAYKNQQRTFSAAIVDLNLPDGSGFEIVKTLKIPTLIMTALNTPENRLQGMELGAVDFVPKPFLFQELRLKLDRLLSRANRPLTLSNKTVIDLTGRTIEGSEGNITFLSDRELKILKLLIEKAPAVVSRDEILNHLGESDSASHRGIDNVILKLRQLMKDEDHQFIKSVRSVGYQWLGEKNES